MAAGLTVGCFIAAFLVLVPLPWHWQARNIPVLSIAAWLFAANIIDGVNSIIWAGNVKVVVPVWCDITTKIQIGGTMALPASCLCICVHLEKIASARQSPSLLTERTRRMIFEAIMCWLVPFIYMALHYVVQGHRFDIIQEFGCRANTYNSIQSVLLVWLPPLVAVALTFVFASLALYHFFQRRLTFARHLQHGSSVLTPSRYFRLMAMAVVQMVWGGFVLSTDVWFSVRHRLRPWISWEDVHSHFSRIDKFPLIIIPKLDLGWTYVGWWSIRISAFIFFVFFAFGQDAVRDYKATFKGLTNTLRLVFGWIRNPVSDEKMLPLFTPVSPPFSKVVDSRSANTTSGPGSHSPTPYFLSTRDATSSLIITPGAQFPIINDTSFSFTLVFRSIP